MAYSDFTARELTTNFKIKLKAGHLFENIQPIAPSNWLNETLQKGRKIGFSSEKSRSERLVSPVLLELWEKNNQSFTIYSGELLTVDSRIGLSGECDFMLSHSGLTGIVTAPIFCIAVPKFRDKKQDIDKGIIQAAAQLIGAKRFNEQDKYEGNTLYGCSTTGVEWSFIKFIENTIVIDKSRYYITELPKLLGILQCIVNATKMEEVE